MNKNLSGVFATEDRKCICFFEDGTARRIDFRDMNEVPLADKIIKNEKKEVMGNLYLKDDVMKSRW